MVRIGTKRIGVCDGARHVVDWWCPSPAETQGRDNMKSKERVWEGKTRVKKTKAMFVKTRARDANYKRGNEEEKGNSM